MQIRRRINGMGALTEDVLANPTGTGEGSIPGSTLVSSSDASALTDYLNTQALINQLTPGYMLPKPAPVPTAINPAWVIGGAVGIGFLILMIGGLRR